MLAYFEYVTCHLMCSLAEIHQIANKVRVGVYGDPDFANMVEPVVNVEPGEDEVAVYGRYARGSSVDEIMTKRA